MVVDRCFNPLGHPDERPLRLAALNSLYETGIRSPLDTAILAVSQPDTQAYAKVDEIPFDFERRRLCRREPR
jgi:P-type Mg2+ transporter